MYFLNITYFQQEEIVTDNFCPIHSYRQPFLYCISASLQDLDVQCGDFYCMHAREPGSVEAPSSPMNQHLKYVEDRFNAVGDKLYFYPED